MNFFNELKASLEEAVDIERCRKELKSVASSDTNIERRPSAKMKVALQEAKEIEAWFDKLDKKV